MRNALFYKTLCRLSIAIPVILTLAFAPACGKQKKDDDNEDEAASETTNLHIKKGKKLLMKEDVEGAKKEFKKALSEEKSSSEARIWGVVALFIEEPPNGGLSMLPEWLVAMKQEPGFGLTDSAIRETKKTITSFRKYLYDKGIETSSDQDVVDLLLGVANVFFTHDLTASQKYIKPTSAYALAWNGNDKAFDYLIDSLKGTNQDNKSLIMKLVPMALEKLKAIAADENHLARVVAQEALIVAHTNDAAMRVFGKYEGIRSILPMEHPIAAKSEKIKMKMIGDKHIDPSDIRWGFNDQLKHSLSLISAGTGSVDESRVLFLSGETSGHKYHSVPFMIHAGTLHPLEIIYGEEKSVELPRFTPLLKIEYNVKDNYFALYVPDTGPSQHPMDNPYGIKGPNSKGPSPVVRVLKAKLDVQAKTLTIDPKQDAHCDGFEGTSMRPVPVAADDAEGGSDSEVAISGKKAPSTSKGPKLRSGAAMVQGSLSKAVIRKIIHRHINEVKFCYERQLAATPGLSGRVEIKFIISGTGTVQMSAVSSSTLGNAKVENCIAQAVRRWTFPRPEGGGVVIVTYPFKLTP